MDIVEIKKSVSAILKEELLGKPYNAFFFGSRVTGTASTRSDLDVGILGKQKVPIETLRLIIARCEALHTLYAIDVVDFYDASKEFKEVAQSAVEKIV